MIVPRTTWPPLLVLCLLACDAAFIGLNAGWRLLELGGDVPPRPQIVQLRADYGLPEFSNFVKYALVAAFLLRGARGAQIRIWAPMATAFLLLLADDVFRIHENASYWIGERFMSDIVGPGKDAVTLGQFPYYVIFGTAVFGAAALTLRRTRGREREAAGARRLVGLLIALAALGAGVDFANSYILESFGIAWLGSLGSLVENGGELIVTSLCVWAAMLINSDRAEPASQTERKASTFRSSA